MRRRSGSRGQSLRRDRACPPPPPSPRGHASRSARPPVSWPRLPCLDSALCPAAQAAEQCVRAALAITLGCRPPRACAPWANRGTLLRETALWAHNPRGARIQLSVARCPTPAARKAGRATRRNRLSPAPPSMRRQTCHFGILLLAFICTDAYCCSSAHTCARPVNSTRKSQAHRRGSLR